MALFLILQTFLGIFAFLLAWAGTPHSLLVVGILAIPLYGAMTIYELRQERYFLSPIVVYLFMSIFYVGIASIWAYACLMSDWSRILRLGVFRLANLMPYIQAVLILGVGSFYFGYKLTTGSKFLQKRIKNHRRKHDMQMSATIWIIFIGLAWAVQILDKMGYNIKQLGAIYANIHYLTLLAPFFILTCRTSVSEKEFQIQPAGKNFFIAAGAALIYLFFSAFQSEMRFPMLFLLAMTLWGYLLQNESGIRSRILATRFRSWILPSLLVVAALFLVVTVIIPFGKKIAKGNYLPSPQDIVDNINNLGETFPKKGIWQFPHRLAGTSLMGLGACIRLHQDNILPDEKVLSLVSVGVVPRIFWPEKPYVSQGAKFSVFLKIGSGRDERHATTATGMTAIGELYWSYGLWGVLIGMTILGMTYGASFIVFSSWFPLHPIRSWVTGILVLNTFLWFESEATSAYVFLAYIWVVFFPFTILNLTWLRSKFPKSVRRTGDTVTLSYRYH